MRIVPFEERHRAAVARFNGRLAQADAGHAFPPDPVSPTLPPGPGRKVYQEFFVAEDGDEVRGGYILKHQTYLADGVARPICDYQLPISEGIIDPQYSLVGVQLLMHALAQQPVMYGLGMGGLEYPLPKMLRAVGWRLEPVPFYFRVLHPQAFLGTRSLFVGRPRIARAATVARRTGAGYVGLKSYQVATFARRAGYLRSARPSAVEVPDFDYWADEIWEDARSSYGFVCERDLATLRILYPPEDGRFHRLLITAGGARIGWALVMTTPMSGHRQFGDMHVGSLIDGFCAPQHAEVVIAAATRWLEGHDVDIIVSNQAHAAWVGALRGAGFLSGPSNFVFAASKALAATIGPLGTCHVNRGDGDGPINL